MPQHLLVRIGSQLDKSDNKELAVLGLQKKYCCQSFAPPKDARAIAIDCGEDLQS